ncbi:unnamed protein product [Amoebophrya sp. A120]|nr:unnamed protein product [Amoebophrya sp. A120]|eukprot:GSA120T00005306001.1
MVFGDETLELSPEELEAVPHKQVATYAVKRHLEQQRLQKNDASPTSNPSSSKIKMSKSPLAASPVSSTSLASGGGGEGVHYAMIERGSEAGKNKKKQADNTTRALVTELRRLTTVLEVQSGVMNNMSSATSSKTSKKTSTASSPLLGPSTKHSSTSSNKAFEAADEDLRRAYLLEFDFSLEKQVRKKWAPWLRESTPSDTVEALIPPIDDEASTSFSPPTSSSTVSGSGSGESRRTFDDFLWQVLGLKMEKIKVRTTTDLPSLTLFVEQVRPDSPADRAGISAGCRLIQWDNKDVALVTSNYNKSSRKNRPLATVSAPKGDFYADADHLPRDQLTGLIRADPHVLRDLLVENRSRTVRLSFLDSTGVTLTGSNVLFAYPTRPEKTVLRGMSFLINAGEKVAFVGGSGSGKSTVLQLLQRCYFPDGGNIQMNGYPLKEIFTQTFRSLVGVVSQDPTLFGSLTIRENLLLGIDDGSRQKISDDAILSILDVLKLRDWVQALPQGLESSGVFLSGGQKQRLSIGRAMLRNPAILILDEATSALDMDSEKQVMACVDSLGQPSALLEPFHAGLPTLQAAMQRRYKVTMIVVAHRLSTVENCDKIVVLKNGRVSQCGTHQELLLDPHGLYASMVQQGATTEDPKQTRRETAHKNHLLKGPSSALQPPATRQLFRKESAQLEPSFFVTPDMGRAIMGTGLQDGYAVNVNRGFETDGMLTSMARSRMMYGLFGKERRDTAPLDSQVEDRDSANLRQTRTRRTTNVEPVEDKIAVPSPKSKSKDGKPTTSPKLKKKDSKTRNSDTKSTGAEESHAQQSRLSGQTPLDTSNAAQQGLLSTMLGFGEAPKENVDDVFGDLAPPSTTAADKSPKREGKRSIASISGGLHTRQEIQQQQQQQLLPADDLQDAPEQRRSSGRTQHGVGFPWFQRTGEGEAGFYNGYVYQGDEFSDDEADETNALLLTSKAPTLGRGPDALLRTSATSYRAIDFDARASAAEAVAAESSSDSEEEDPAYDSSSSASVDDERHSRLSSGTIQESAMEDDAAPRSARRKKKQPKMTAAEKRLAQTTFSGSLKRLLRAPFTTPHEVRAFLVPAILLSTGIGICRPIAAWILCKTLLSNKGVPVAIERVEQGVEVERNLGIYTTGRRWMDLGCIGLGGIGLTLIFLLFMQQWIYYTKLITQVLARVRARVFRSIVTQELLWHDLPENAPDRLCNLLQRSCNAFVELIPCVGNLTQDLVTVLGSLGVSFGLAWEMSLVLFFAIIGITVMLFWLTATFGDPGPPSVAELTTQKYVSESIFAVRVLRGLNGTEEFYLRFKHMVAQEQEAQLITSRRQAIARGLTETSQALLFLTVSGFGTILIAKGVSTGVAIFTVLFVFILIASSGANLATTFGLIAEGKRGAAELFFTLDRKPMIQYTYADPVNMVPEPQRFRKLARNQKKIKDFEQIRFQNVHFSYPSRPKNPILRGLTLEINRGDTVALCGPSGGGKSTVMQLLLRFYDPNQFVSGLYRKDRNVQKYLLHGSFAGRVVLNKDELDLRTAVDLKSWRSIIGYVGQEPVLFDMSAWDNIVYSLEAEEQAKVTVDQVKEVAKQAMVDFLGEVAPPPASSAVTTSPTPSGGLPGFESAATGASSPSSLGEVKTAGTAVSVDSGAATTATPRKSAAQVGFYPSGDIMMDNITSEGSKQTPTSPATGATTPFMPSSYSQQPQSAEGKKPAEIGWHTLLGTRASLLSGGQRQRLSIARALLRKPQILLLDEATAALDNNSQREVQAALDALLQTMGKRMTVITIAHRLSTIRNYSKILVIKQGALVEQGNHDMLLQQNGIYAGLYYASVGDEH